MQNLMHWLGRHLGALMATGSAVASTKAGTGVLKAEEPNNAKLRITVMGVAYTCAVGMVDLMAARGMNFDFFYLLGCAFVGWAAGARPAALITLAAGGFVYWDGMPVNGSTISNWVVHWNLIIRLLGFGAVGWLAAEVGRRSRSLERSI